MSKTKRLSPKRYLVWAIISDSPREGEGYLSEAQLTDNILLDVVDGVRTGKLHFQPLPERKKTAKVVINAAKSTKFGLDTASGGEA
jgi:hypothetical protein